MKSLKIKSGWLPESGLRMDASYHLGDGPISKVKLKKSPFKMTTLEAASVDIFKGNIFKRCYVNSPEKGYPFLSPSDMMKADINGGKYVSKKYTDTANLLLKKGWILVSRSGTLGNVVYTNDEFEGMVGSDDLIRILPNNKNVLGGYLYAYLASKYGYALLTQSSYGGVVKHIEPHHIKDVPIPILPAEKQKEIHDLIVEAATLKVAANMYLRDSVNYFDSIKIHYKYGTAYSSKISISNVSNGYKRFDSSYSIVSSFVKNSLETNKVEFVTIRSQANKIFIGPRSKRNYVKSGIPFLSTTAMQKSNPTKTDKYISAKTVNGFIVEEGWILTTRSGTLGDTIYTMPCISGYAISEDAIRIVLIDNAQISNEYLFAFLKSEIGRNSLLSGSYGSVIQHLNEDKVGDIKVPLLNKSTILFIENKVRKHLENTNEAISKENRAIELIEKEIESWQDQ